MMNYHGTTKSRAENIKKFGFYTQHSVNITSDYDEALEYAKYLADDEDDFPCVIKVKIKSNAKPKSEYGLDSMAYKSKDVLLINE